MPRSVQKRNWSQHLVCSLCSLRCRKGRPSSLRQTVRFNILIYVFFECMYFSCIIHYNVCRYDGRYNLHKRVLTVRKKIYKMTALERNSRFLPKDALPAGTHAVPRKRKSRDEDTDGTTRFVKALESAKVQSRLDHRVETLRRSLVADKARSPQAQPPDDKSPSTTPTPPSAPQSSPYSSVYDEIPDSVLSGLGITPPDSLPQLRPTSPDSVRQDHNRSPTPSFPPSTAHTVVDTPDPTSFSYPLSYPESIQPADRDHALDVEACMIAVNDLNRMTRHLVSDRPLVPKSPDPTGVPTTREDVVETLGILKYMIDRLFNRLNK